jgi:acyl carrier protein
MGNLCPLGVKGELCVSGIGVGRGYWRDEAKTAKSFVKNPFSLGDEYRMYKTGDLARWLPDGNIEYLGRIDEQVKIRGYRIELQEIESVLLMQPGVAQCAVVVKEDVNGLKHLVGYIVLEEEADKASIEKGLRAVLPEYMIPRQWVELKELPLTGNGKIDRKALPEAELGGGVDYIAPSTAVEQQLVTLWAEVLKIDESLIGIHNNFFELGGHSLRAMVLINKVFRHFDKEITLPDFFTNPTIKQMGDMIEMEIWLSTINDNAFSEETEVII